VNVSLKKRRKPSHPVQLALPMRGVAKPMGARRGPKPGPRPLVRHRTREASSAGHPLHVVIRSKFRSLRSQFVFPTVRKALADATRARQDFRITHYSVQGDHLHLLVEANSKQALSRGMQGLAIRIARRVNRLTSRSGKLWADRFFSRALSSPRAVRNALAYVLNNFKKHRAPDDTRIDPCSSAPYFAGFRELRGKPPWDLPRSRQLPITPHGVPPPACNDEMPILEARTWLGRVGWRKAGLIGLAEAPRAPQ
jgi:REP element-mobilizing transposase RayT